MVNSWKYKLIRFLFLSLKLMLSKIPKKVKKEIAVVDGSNSNLQYRRRSDGDEFFFKSGKPPPVSKQSESLRNFKKAIKHKFY